MHYIALLFIMYFAVTNVFHVITIYIFSKQKCNTVFFPYEYKCRKLTVKYVRLTQFQVHVIWSMSKIKLSYKSIQQNYQYNIGTSKRN